MRRALILLCLASLASPVLAAEDKGKDKDKKGGENGQYVDVSQVALPVVQDGRLVNYVFVQVRVLLTPGANNVQLSAKEPYFRDALVRAGTRTPFTVAGDPNKLDDAALKRVMAAEAAKIAGPGAVAGVQVMNEQPKRFVPKG